MCKKLELLLITSKNRLYIIILMIILIYNNQINFYNRQINFYDRQKLFLTFLLKF